MTRESDRDAWLDAVIDDVASAMTRGVSPDLRARIDQRLDRPAPGMRWWQPAVAAAALAIAVVWWNGGREPVPVVSHPPATPIAAAPATRPTLPEPAAPAAVRARAAKRTPAVERRGDPSLVLEARQAGLDPVAPDALSVEPLSHPAPEFIPVDISAIAVAAIVVDPLPRSMP